MLKTSLYKLILTFVSQGTIFVVSCIQRVKVWEWAKRCHRQRMVRPYIYPNSALLWENFWSSFRMSLDATTSSAVCQPTPLWWFLLLTLLLSLLLLLFVFVVVVVVVVVLLCVLCGVMMFFFPLLLLMLCCCRCMMNVNVLCDDDEINKEEDMMMWGDRLIFIFINSAS